MRKIQSLLICSVTTEIACSNSIGIAMYPQDANNLETLIQYADKALYQAKKQKGTYSFYQNSISSTFLECAFLKNKYNIHRNRKFIK